MSEVRRARRTGEDIRGLLLDAARELFAANGYAGTTTRDIIRRAGVSEQSLFSHFESKQGLFEAAVVAPFKQFITTYTAEWSSAHSEVDDPAEMLVRYVDGLYTIVREQRQLFLALTLDHFLEGPAMDVVGQIEQFTAELTQAHGYVFDAGIAARSVIMLVVGWAVFEEQVLPGRERRDIIAEITATLLNGLTRGHAQSRDVAGGSEMIQPDG